MSDPVLGDALPADFAAFPGLLAQLGYPAEPEAIAPRIQRIRDAGGRVVVARRGEAVVGLMALAFLPLVHHDMDILRVSALVVAGHARGTGVGRRLMQLAEQIANEHGCSRVEVTSAEHRYPAHAFYRNLGYSERPRRFVKQLVLPGVAAPANAYRQPEPPEKPLLAADAPARPPASAPAPAPAPDAPRPAKTPTP